VRLLHGPFLHCSAVQPSGLVVYSIDRPTRPTPDISRNRKRRTSH
jgi:hypothetical protein